MATRVSRQRSPDPVNLGADLDASVSGRPLAQAISGQADSSGHARADQGRVRAILVTHAASLLPSIPLPATAASATVEPSPSHLADPNELVPVQRLQDLLQAHTPARQREVAEAYVALWGRTFRTLVRHLRGRPERALSLLASEVVPFLRGDRLAARLDTHGPRGATLTLSPGIPAAYLESLVASFVSLSGATVTATPGAAPEAQRCVLHVGWQTAPSHRLARLAQWLAALRLHFLVLVAASAALGLAMASRDRSLPPWMWPTVLVGALLAQTGSNALHDLRYAHPAGPLGPQRLSRTALTAIRNASLAGAALVGLLLAVRAPITLVFAVLGLGASLAYGPVRLRGLGPLLAGIVYGPLVALGSLLAASGTGSLSLVHVLATFPLGFAAATLLLLDDLADQPLDEAGGQRTLAVRLPRRRQGVAFGLLAGAATAGAALLVAVSLLDRGFAGRAAPLDSLALAAIMPVALGAALLVRTVQERIGEPARLGGARLGALLLVAATWSLLLLGVLA